MKKSFFIDMVEVLMKKRQKNIQVISYDIKLSL